MSALAEVEPPRHRREHRAEAFAIAAGVADLQHAADLGLASAARAIGMTRARSSCQRGGRRRWPQARTSAPSRAACAALRAGDAPEGGADAHADPGGVALAQHVARHHLAGDEQVRARHAAEAHRRGLVDLQAQVGERHPGPQRDSRRTAAYRAAGPSGSSAASSLRSRSRPAPCGRTFPAGTPRCRSRACAGSAPRRARAHAPARSRLSAVVPGKTGGMKRPTALASMIDHAICPGCCATRRPQIA